MKRRNFLKTTVSWDVFNKEYESVSATVLKQQLIIADIDKGTEAFLSNLIITNNKDFCIQLMSIPEYQMC